MVKNGQVHVVRLRGSLKLGQGVDDLRTALDRLLGEGHAKFILNLAEVPMIDSSGIGLLVRIHTASVKANGAIKLVQPTRLAIQTLKLVGVLSLFEVKASDAEALASFGEPA